VRNSTCSLTYSLWHTYELGQVLKPPYTVIRRLKTTTDGEEDLLLATQETAHFVEQFGPYDMELSDDDES